MAAPLITSPSNPLVRRARSLLLRRHREEQGACLVEGIRPVWQAVDHGADVEALIVAPNLLRSEPARAMVAEAEERGVRAALVGDEIFERLASREHPSGLAAIVRTPRRALQELPVAPEGLYAAVEAAGNPGNLGSIIRTMDAVGGSAVLVVGSATDPYHPAAVKASMGTVFAMPVVHLGSAAELTAWCRKHGVKIISTSGDMGRPHWDIAYRPPCAVLFGSEGSGLTPQAHQESDVVAHIPMTGSAGSLNLAVAAGIILYEARRTEWTAARRERSGTGDR